MLQAIRSRAESYIVKALFAVLTATFALWGIGDIFRNWGSDTSVAKVGSLSITPDQVSQEVRNQIDRLRATLPNIDAEQAKQLGLVNAALDRIVASNLLTLETQRLNLLIGDDAVRQAIVDNPNFKNAQGNFDRDRYLGLLAANHLNDAQFQASVRSSLIRDHLTSAIADGVTAPAPMVDGIYRNRAELRTADLVTLTPNAVPASPVPTDDQISAYYEAHKEAFQRPELRTASLALLTLDSVAPSMTVTDDKLKQQYAARASDFQTPEQREVQQMLLSDEAKAKTAKAALTSGQAFAAVAKAEAGADDASIDLGWVKRDDLPGPLADAVFALVKGGITDPVETSFGWHILRVTDIKPAQVQTFDSVKDQLSRDLQREAAGDTIAKTANDIDDAMAGGASFEQLVQKFGLKTQTVPAVDAQGRDADGKPVDLPEPKEPILQAAFSTGANQTSSLTELGDNGYVLVHVDKVTPAAVPPLAEVKADVIAQWQAEQRKDALDKLAQSLIQEVNSGKSLKDVAAAHKLGFTSTPKVSRIDSNPTVAPAVVAAIFGAKQGAVVSAPADDNVVVAQVTSVEPGDPTKDPRVKQLSDQIGAQLKDDTVEAFDRSLRQQFPVEIHQSNLDHVL